MILLCIRNSCYNAKKIYFYLPEDFHVVLVDSSKANFKFKCHSRCKIKKVLIYCPLTKLYKVFWGKEKTLFLTPVLLYFHTAHLHFSFNFNWSGYSYFARSRASKYNSEMALKTVKFSFLRFYLTSILVHTVWVWHHLHIFSSPVRKEELFTLIDFNSRLLRLHD